MQIKINIEVNNKIEIYKSYLSIINWTLKDNSLSNKEIDILAFFMYYNELYANIPEEEAKIELLMSSSTKKKIKQKLNMSSSMFDTYLTRIKKKGLINNNGIQGVLNKIKLDKNYIIFFNVVTKEEKEIKKIEDIEENREINNKIEELSKNKKVVNEIQEEKSNIFIPKNIGGYAELERYKKMLEEEEDSNLEYEDI